MFFKYFSRQTLFSITFQDSPVYSSTFQACANPELGHGHPKLIIEIYFVWPISPLIHTKTQEHWHFGFKEDNIK